MEIFGDVPDAVRQMIEHRQMHAEASIHADTNFLESLTAEQLKSLEGIIRTSISNTNYGSYIMGRIDGVLEYGHGICSCGEKHETIDSLLGDEEVKVAAKAAEAAEQHIPDPDEPATEPDPEEDLRHSQLLDRYGLEYVLAKDGTGLQLRCANCYMPYQSAEDRALRVPGIDGCAGCQDYSAHGTRFLDITK